MRILVSVRMLVAVCSVWAAAGVCAAQQRPIRIEVKCEDPSIQLQLNQQIVSEVALSLTHRLVLDDTARIQVKVLAAPVRVQGGDDPLLGVGLATLTRRKDGQRMKLVSFTNSFVPLSELERAMRKVVRDSIAEDH